MSKMALDLLKHAQNVESWARARLSPGTRVNWHHVT
jgi:hypothetical protein